MSDPKEVSAKVASLTALAAAGDISGFHMSLVETLENSSNIPADLVDLLRTSVGLTVYIAESVELPPSFFTDLVLELSGDGPGQTS